MHVNMEMKIESLPPQRIVYVRQIGPYGPANIQAMSKLKQWAMEHQRLNESAILLGIPLDNPEKTLPEHCRYDACLVVSDGENVDHPFSERKIEGGNYVVCKIKHTQEAVQEAWENIIPFVKNNGYEVATQPIIERYKGDMIMAELCEICVPVQPIRE